MELPEYDPMPPETLEYIKTAAPSRRWGLRVRGSPSSFRLLAPLPLHVAPNVIDASNPLAQKAGGCRFHTSRLGSVLYSSTRFIWLSIACGTTYGFHSR